VVECQRVDEWRCGKRRDSNVIPFDEAPTLAVVKIGSREPNGALLGDWLMDESRDA
jgi:hypothetical protein